MIKTIVILFFTALFIFLLSTCYYDSEEYLFPRTGNYCDTTNVTFALSVKPILQNSCYACHSNSTSSFGRNIRLEDYNDVIARVSDGHLLGSINHAPGYIPMPRGAPKLEDCKIIIIQKWIESGFPNN
ncbi:MAG TPA: hypothetical protein VJ203_05815 [Bacteroidales bacterium]|nr:hypothetical protein [Bacteroidales bacterium]